jgi:hypothetical protein
VSSRLMRLFGPAYRSTACHPLARHFPRSCYVPSKLATWLPDSCIGKVRLGRARAQLLASAAPEASKGWPLIHYVV